ncbi:MAG: class I adenylate-forming enzyme family protein [Gemmobacter sp.]
MTLAEAMPDGGGAGHTTVPALVAMQAAVAPGALAIEDGALRLTYGALQARIEAVAADLAARGIGRGDRVAVLAENSAHYTILHLAAARLGAMVACQNWRLAPAELAWCIALVAPALVAVSARFEGLAPDAAGAAAVVRIDALGASGRTEPAARPEDGLHIIYTSGTTGRPKAAVISHRAQIARMAALRLDLGLAPGDAYVSWTPMFHIGGTEHLLSTLMSGGPGVILDGFDPDRIVDVLAAHRVGWLLLVPATIEPLIAALAARRPAIKGVRAVGCMADLVPGAVIAAITRALDAPYVDTFGATETGMPPLSAALIAPGVAPARLPKRLSVLTELRLCDPAGRDVADGETGEAWVRGPTLFSGYWNAPEANAASFSDGWFRMGDLFRRTAEGYEFAGRSKYLIKSGGENIYPAEIERVLLADPRVADAVVVRRADARWGEVPVAVIARADASLDAAAVEALCRAALAGYKRPRAVVFMDHADLPRNVSGKILREAVERMVAT